MEEEVVLNAINELTNLCIKKSISNKNLTFKVEINQINEDMHIAVFQYKPKIVSIGNTIGFKFYNFDTGAFNDDIVEDINWLMSEVRRISNER